MSLGRALLLLTFMPVACGVEQPKPDREAPRPRDGFADWPMPSAKGSGLPNEPSYAFDDDTVTDRVTGLVWQRRFEDDSSFTWDEARTECDRQTLAAHDDWRLPSRIELVSLLDLSRTDPSIDPTTFPSTPSGWFWTVSELAFDSSLAWYVYFYFGYPDTDAKESPLRVRCVRGGTLPAGHYVIEEDVVHDVRTGLRFERALSPDSYTFEEAQEHCAALSLGGADDWRVPSMPELETLLDESVRSPAIDSEVFPDTPPVAFWTSSPWSGSLELGWYVSFDYGNALYDLASNRFRVRCVR